GQYLELFMNNGYNDIRLIQNFTKEDLIELGINKVYINLFLRNIELFKSEKILFEKFLNKNKLNEYKTYLGSISILTKDRSKNLLIKLKNTPNVLINEKSKKNGFPFNELFNIYKQFEIDTNWFQEDNHINIEKIIFKLKLIKLMKL